MAKRSKRPQASNGDTGRTPDAALRRDQMLAAIQGRHFLHVRELS